jgi:hypothetical protein
MRTFIVALLLTAGLFATFVLKSEGSQFTGKEVVLATSALRANNTGTSYTVRYCVVTNVTSDSVFVTITLREAFSGFETFSQTTFIPPGQTRLVYSAAPLEYCVVSFRGHDSDVRAALNVDDATGSTIASARAY